MPITFDEYMKYSHENNKESISNSFITAREMFQF